MHISISKVNFTSIGINIAKVDFGRYDSGGEPQLNGLYIAPADASAISVTPNDSYYTIHGKYLKYSLNGKKWKDWNGSVTIDPGQKLYLKGEDDYVWNSSTSGKLITADGYYNVGGDISSLTNFITEVKSYIFYNLFLNDSYIKDASSLLLPASTLAFVCYQYMFKGCTALTTAPELPATTLAESCYSNMFQGCSSLTTAPALHATTLADYCYSNMFNGCTSLTSAPELPATTLVDGCYYDMFHGCTALTTAPELPATTLAYSCYQGMFYNCASLKNAPELNATALYKFCYYSMFEWCTSLTTAPELPATTLATSCYDSMFARCSSLNNITMLATDISATECLNNWVDGVAPTGTFTKAASMTSLPIGVNGIPEGWTVADYTDYMTLSALGDGDITITIPAAINSSYATSLSYSKDKSTWNETIIDSTAQTISIPVTSGENVYLKGIAKQLGDRSTGVNINSTTNINASGNVMSLLYGDNYKNKIAFTNGSQYTLGHLFKNNTHLINAEQLILHATTLTNGCYYDMFQGCTSLTTAPELPATTLKQYCYWYMFDGCTSLTTAPELPATTLLHSCYRGMLQGCTSLTIAPALPATIIADKCYAYMFAGCTSLATAPELPATTLTPYCYEYMFRGCTSLTVAPELPATTLARWCYVNMFASCRNLNNITMLATDISASSCLSNWVNGVASTGTFTKAASMTSLPTGVNGIPEGWTVKDYGVVDYPSEYMTLSALGDGEIKITIPAQVDYSVATSLSYSKDKSTWNETIIDNTAQTISIPVTSGENVYLKGIAKQLGNNSTGVNINSTANINASGNIMSLLYGDDYKDKVALTSGSTYTFNKLFNNNSHLINAENLILPATMLTNNCYQYMFSGCSSLTTAPELPAATLTPYCYYHMFSSCKSLTTAPALPATTLADSCYENMFKNCTSLTNAPELPATKLSSWCYSYMFYGCTSLTTATELHAAKLAYGCYYGMFYGCKSLTTAPELHAATLNPECYNAMFSGCTALTTAPELHATKLSSLCYYNMFSGCTSLNNIIMLATDISASSCLSNWVNGVAPTGTFTKSPEMTTLPTGASGIPEGWTVVDYGAA